jgi:hypothetical protein
MSLEERVKVLEQRVDALVDALQSTILSNSTREPRPSYSPTPQSSPSNNSNDASEWREKYAKSLIGFQLAQVPNVYIFGLSIQGNIQSLLKSFTTLFGSDKNLKPANIFFQYQSNPRIEYYIEARHLPEYKNRVNIYIPITIERQGPNPDILQKLGFLPTDFFLQISSSLRDIRETMNNMDTIERIKELLKK